MSNSNTVYIYLMRSRYKLPFFTTFLWSRIYSNKIGRRLHYYTKHKSIRLHPLLQHIRFFVYNGQTRFSIVPRTAIYKQKLGAFIMTRKNFIFKSKKRKKQARTAKKKAAKKK